MGAQQSKPENNQNIRPEKKGNSAGKNTSGVGDNRYGKIRRRSQSRTAENVRKKRILESVPDKVFDTEHKDKGPKDIKTAGKVATKEYDQIPLIKPDFRISKPATDVKQLKNELTVGSKGRLGSNPQLSNELLSLPKKLEATTKFRSSLEKPKRFRASTGSGKANLKPKVPSKENNDHSLTLHNEREKKILKTVLGRMFPTTFTKLKAQENPAGFQRIKSGIEAILSKDEETSALKFLRNLKEKVFAGGDLTRLQQFGIPDQRELLTLALSSDTITYDFGGIVNHYYSFIMRNYIPINMLERYRGVSLVSGTLKAIDVTTLEEKSNHHEKLKAKKSEKHDSLIQVLRKAAMDDAHFEFLKDLAENQLVTLPITILQDTVNEIIPIINKTQAYYLAKLGPNHECTEQATIFFISILNRVLMYNSL